MRYFEWELFGCWFTWPFARSESYKSCSIIVHKICVMPKVKESSKLFFQRMSAAHPNIFEYDDKVLLCSVCYEKLKAKQASQVNQHLQTAKHVANFRRPQDTTAFFNSTITTWKSKCLYQKMVHITCLAHGLHRVAEFIRSQFEDVNDLISNVKILFRKVNASS